MALQPVEQVSLLPEIIDARPQQLSCINAIEEGAFRERNKSYHRDDSRVSACIHSNVGKRISIH